MSDETDHLTSRLLALPWFENVSVTGSGSPHGLRIGGLEAARSSLRSAEWLAVNEAAGSDLQAVLSLDSNFNVREHNNRVRELRAEALPDLLPGVFEFCSTHDLGDQFISLFEWQVIYWAAETWYASRGVPRFFGVIMDVYGSGHLPCGWAGVYPGGELLWV